MYDERILKKATDSVGLCKPNLLNNCHWNIFTRLEIGSCYCSCVLFVSSVNHNVSLLYKVAKDPFGWGVKSTNNLGNRSL